MLMDEITSPRCFHGEQDKLDISLPTTVGYHLQIYARINLMGAHIRRLTAHIRATEKYVFFYLTTKTAQAALKLICDLSSLFMELT